MKWYGLCRIPSFRSLFFAKGKERGTHQERPRARRTRRNQTAITLPPRFDLIDSSYLADNLGILNVVMAASPLLKPSPHAVVRTDLRRSGPARKRLTLAKDVDAAVAAQAEVER